MRNPELRIALLKSAAKSMGYKVRQDTTCDRWLVTIPAENAVAAKGRQQSGQISFSFSLDEAEAFLQRQQPLH